MESQRGLPPLSGSSRRLPPGRTSLPRPQMPTEWQLEVHNWGLPIASEAMERLFMPMVRGVAADSGHRNVGLGLFIVNEIAKAHRGTLEVKSTADLGTAFRISVGEGGETQSAVKLSN